MTSFEMIKYHNQEYPADVPLRIEEIAAHFDITKVDSKLEVSLHTEYSYGKRRFDSALISKYPEILAAQRNGVPQLWKNEAWAVQFADFIITLSDSGSVPRIIEIHPPFSDYSSIEGFIDTYSFFEEKIKERFPKAEILVENRCGSLYRGGRFIISKINEVAELCEAIERNKLQLKIAYDIPQIYTAHNVKRGDVYLKLLEETKSLRKYIGGVHLWGKKLSNTGRRVAHSGNLDTYFGDYIVKYQFLYAFKECFDDDVIRKMVLEVNSGNEDLLSIIADLKDVGIAFM